MSSTRTRIGGRLEMTRCARLPEDRLTIGRLREDGPGGHDEQDEGNGGKQVFHGALIVGQTVPPAFSPNQGMAGGARNGDLLRGHAPVIMTGQPRAARLTPMPFMEVRLVLRAVASALLLCVTAAAPRAYADPPPGRRYALTAWAAEKGLPPGDVFAITQDSDGYLWERTMPYVDLHVGEGFRAFGQFVSAFEWGDATGVKPPDVDRADVLQAFLDVRIPIGEDQSLLVRPGRQILRYGSERLIGMRYGANVPLPFDAALARVESGPWRVDALYGRPVATERGEWDDRSNDAQALWLLYTTHALPSIGKRAGIDAYYVGYSDELARFAQAAGDELRHTLGARFFGEKSNFDWDVEAFYQFGQYDTVTSDGSISAWAVGSNVGYTLNGAPLRPRLGMKSNVISGDDDPGDPDLQTFNSLFPKRKYFGEMGLLGPYNLIDLHPSLTLQLTDKTSFELASVFYWRFSTNDGIYDTPGNVIRPGFDSDDRFIGTQLETALTHRFGRELEVSATYEIFLPGTFIEHTGPDEVVHFLGIELLYRF